jgi:DNA-binding NarL/FixJ family response regulator
LGKLETILPIRVLIADDHAIVREGLRLFLTEEADAVEVVGEAADGAEAVTLAERLRPDVILMDLIMPRRDGIEATRLLKERGVPSRVLILTSFADDKKVREAIQAGAIGYLMKDVLRRELMEAIRSAAKGVPTLHPEAQQYLIRHVVNPSSDEALLGTLTERETDVLRYIARGLSNKEIAVALHLSVGTVKGYVSAIFAKLGVADRTQAALYAARHGLADV